MPITRSFLFVSGSALPALSILSTAAFAQDDQPPVTALPPVVVSATRIPTPEDQIASSVTVITADDLAAKQIRTLPDALNDVPGLNVVQTGGPGGQTSVFMRGTNANHTKVLIDGIDVSDPSCAGPRAASTVPTRSAASSASPPRRATGR